MTLEMMITRRPRVSGANPVSAPLYRPDWRYVEKSAMDDFTRADWELIEEQRAVFNAENQAATVIRMLRTTEDEKAFGYRVNFYQHSLQSATKLYLDGHEEEDIVVGLLHDIGFTACPSRHGAFAAELMGAYVSERNVWMLQRHQVFGDHHAPTHPQISDPEARDRWRAHEYFDWGVEFAEKYDQGAIDPKYETAPLELFVPMVERIFARPPRRIPID